MKRWVIGVDLGGTQIRAIRTDLNAQKQSRAQLQTEPQEGPQAVLQRIFAAIREAMLGVDPKEVLGIGIGAPGPIDQSGRLYDPPNLPGWEGISLTEPIFDQFQIPTFAGNDANLAALGEVRFGAGQGLDHLIFMTVGTGIGGGVISSGKLLLGARGFAAEVGHQTLDPDGPICSCGQPGHLEALASGPAIARRTRERLEAGAVSSIAEYAEAGREITAKSVTDAAQHGDKLALELLQEAGTYIGLGLVNLIHILEPQRILLGGGVSQAGELLLEPIRQTVHDRVMSPIYREVAIRPAALGKDVGLMGAVALVLEESSANSLRQPPA